MGAEDILNILNRNPNKEFTSVEIADKTKLACRTVRRVLKALLKDVSENVRFRILTSEEKINRYGRAVGKRNIFIYWINN